MADYTLYGSEMSLFTGKVRGYLRWKGVDFDEVGPSMHVMQEVLIPKIGWPVVPVLQTPDDRWVQDTGDIIDEIERQLPSPAVMPEGPVQQFVSRLIELYADEWLMLPAMHYRWHYNLDWVLGEFGKNSAPDLPADEQRAVGEKTGSRFRGSVPMLGINAQTIPGIEASYEAFLAAFEAHLQNHPFVLGDRPCRADYGLQGPLYAHLYRDPKSGELMEKLAPTVADWVRRVQQGDGGSGALLANDEIPGSLLPILQRMMQEYLPVLQQAVDKFSDWAKTAEAGAELPPAMIGLNFEMEGISGQAISRAITFIRLQAALDVLASMDEDARSRAAALLDQVDGRALLELILPQRVERLNYKVHLAR